MLKPTNFRLVVSKLFSILFILFISIHSAIADIDNKGTEFLFAFMPQLQNSATAELHLTSDEITDVIVNYPMINPTFTTSVTLTPGSVTIVSLPTATHNSWAFNSIQNNLVHASSDKEFVAYQINRVSVSSDAALGLPIDTMNLEYFVSTYIPAFRGAEFVVYAAFDNTEVTITPTNAMIGRASGVPFTITLNQGEGYLARSATTSGVSGDLTGTSIVASRPIGMINGNGCNQVPFGTTFCDHTFEVAQPVASWGTSAAAANLPNRPNGTVYRILGSQDNTNVIINGLPFGVVNKGGFLETPQLTGNQFFEADKPIFVVQHMTGISAPNAVSGDPAKANIIPSAQYQNAYTFSTVGGSQFVENYVSIIADNTDVGSLTLDGVPILASNFTPIPGTSLSSAVMALSDGPHQTESTNPHGITVEGFNSFDSYLYPGGALFEFINPIGDPFPPLCSINSEGNSPFAFGSVRDDTPSEDVNNNGVLDPGEDLNNNGVIDADTGVFFINESNNINVNVIVDPFTPGDGLATFFVEAIIPEQPASITIIGTDGAGNTCEQNIVLVEVNQPLMCDVDNDNDVDRNDIVIIRSARNQAASGPNDPLDINGDGIINLNDARACVRECTIRGCAEP